MQMPLLLRIATMPPKIRRLCTSCLLLHALTLFASGQRILGGRELEQRLDQWIQPYATAYDFSGIVLIAQGDKILVKKAYGMADFGNQTPNTVATRFRVASLSKTFTAAAIELLVQRGKLRLNDTLEHLIPGIANGDKITIEQLLSHESGVGILDTPDRYTDCHSSQEMLRRLRLAKPLFAPGTSDSYSNEGYFLLALVIEKISSTSYAQFLQQNIFAPLKMTATGSTCKVLPAGHNATGNVPGEAAGALVPMAVNEAVEIGPGSIYSNARDLYTWLRAVDTRAQYSALRWEYPYGWGKRNYSRRDLIEQSGILEGFNAHMALYPKEHIYAVVLSNVQSGFFQRIPRDLESVLFGGESSKPPAITAVTLSAAQLEPYVGEYATDANPYHQTIFLDGGKLAMRWGIFPFPRLLTPTVKDTFFFRYEYAKVLFERDSSGRVMGMSWQWGDSPPMKFKKLEPLEKSPTSN